MKTLNNEFNFRFNNEELQNRFLEFVNNNLKQFFSSSHRTPTYTIPLWQAESMVNEGGKYQKRFKELANRIGLADTINQRAAMANTFLTIHLHYGSSLAKVYNELDRLINAWDSYVGHLVDWEIVWYTRYKDIASGKVTV